MYAIIAAGGKQYKVSEGDRIRVEKIDLAPGDPVVFDQVLALRDDDTVKAGKDVANAKVKATVLKNGKSKKVVVYKYKSKTGYHKKIGHRQLYTEVQIDAIEA